MTINPAALVTIPTLAAFTSKRPYDLRRLLAAGQLPQPATYSPEIKWRLADILSALAAALPKETPDVRP